MPVDRTEDGDRGNSSEQRTADGGQGRVSSSEGPNGSVCDGVAAQCLETQPDRAMGCDGGQGGVNSSEGPDGSMCDGLAGSYSGTQPERGMGCEPVSVGRDSSCVDKGVGRERTDVSTSGVSSPDSDCDRHRDEHGNNTAENDSGSNGDVSHSDSGSDRCGDTHGSDTAGDDSDGNASSCTNSGNDSADNGHGSDTNMKEEHSSGATKQDGSSRDFGQEGDQQRQLLGPIRRQRQQQHRCHRRQNNSPMAPPQRRQWSQEQRGEQNASPMAPPPPARQSLNLPPSVLERWRAVGRQWGVPDDDDDAIARILMRNYEDVRAGRPPRPPPPRCQECGEGLVPVPCGACGPDRYSVRLSHHDDDTTPQHRSHGRWAGGGKGGGSCGRC